MLTCAETAFHGRRQRVLPRRLRLHALLLESPDVRCETRVSDDVEATTCGLDVREINRYATETYMDIDLRTLPHRALSQPFAGLELLLQVLTYRDEPRDRY